MAKHLNLNDLPIELHYKIFSYLWIDDLFNLRLVSKKSNYAISQFGIEELCFINPGNELRTYWFHTYKPVDFRYFTCTKTKLFILRSSIFNLKCLKRLWIEDGGDDDVISLADLSKRFIKLEDLRIGFRYCYKSKNQQLNLPNLKRLYIRLNRYHKIKFELPKLEALDFVFYDETWNYLTFSHPQTLRHLSLSGFHPNLSIFSNLNSLSIYEVPKVHGEIVLTTFPMLNELAFRFATSSELENIIKHKSTLYRTDLKIYYLGIELFDIDDRHDISSINYNKFDGYMRYYSRLKNISYEYDIDYSRLMKLVNDQSININLNDFFLKFCNIQHIIINEKIQNENQLTRFIEGCENLTELHIENSLLPQSFYNLIPSISCLTNLSIIEKTHVELDFEFILRMFHLEMFSTNLELNVDTISKLDNLRKLFTANFYFSQRSIRIKRDGEQYKFSLKGEKTYLIKYRFSLDKMVEYLIKTKNIEL